MRLATLSAAMCLAACNQIFGIENTTQLPDEEAGVEMKFPLALRITQQRAIVTNEGTPRTETTVLTSAEVTSVMIGPLTASDDALVQATFEDGAFVYQRRAPDGMPMSVPMPVLEPLRAVVTIPGEPPLELQWTDAGEDATLAYARIGRENGPGSEDDFLASSGWLVEGAPDVLAGNVLFTTGSWWETPVAGGMDQLQILWNATGTRTLADTRVRPSAAAGDLAILVERVLDSPPRLDLMCTRVTNRSVTFPAPPQVDPFSDAVDTTDDWSTAAQKANVDWAVPPTSELSVMALGTLIDTMMHTRRGTVAFGFLPNAELDPVLSIGKRAKPGFQDPPIMTLLECPPDRSLLNSGGPGYAVVNVLENNFQAAVVAQMKWARGSGDAVFESGFEIVTLAAGTPGQAKTAAPERTAPFATAMTVTRDAAPLDLTDGTMDGAPLAGTGPLLLTFAPETGANLAVPLWSVSLVRVEGATRTVERVMLTSAQQLAFPAPRGGTYVFVIRGHLGHPGAANGDFARVAFPQMATLVTTRSFVVP